MILPIDYTKASRRDRRFARLEYERLQGGVCPCCDAPLSGPTPEPYASIPIRRELFPKGFFAYPVHLHHDHKTGMTVAAVHAMCNAILWQVHGE